MITLPMFFGFCLNEGEKIVFTSVISINFNFIRVGAL